MARPRKGGRHKDTNKFRRLMFSISALARDGSAPKASLAFRQRDELFLISRNDIEAARLPFLLGLFDALLG